MPQESQVLLDDVGCSGEPEVHKRGEKVKKQVGRRPLSGEFARCPVLDEPQQFGSDYSVKSTRRTASLHEAVRNAQEGRALAILGITFVQVCEASSKQLLEKESLLPWFLQ